MKNKKLTYILIPIVVLIWGYAILQLFSDDKKVINPISEFVFEDDELTKDSLNFEPLLFNFSDPFLSRNIVKSKYFSAPKSSVPKSRKNVKKKALAIRNIQINWPRIKYGGTINNSKALITINNQLEILNVNDEFQSVKILEVNDNSIKVQFDKEVKTIMKNR